MNKIFANIKRLIPKQIIVFLLPFYHWFLALFGAIRYGFPSYSMKVIAVTGTSGKTTTVEFLHAIFSKAGFRTASLSSLRFKILNKEEPNMLKMTMPGRSRVQKFLALAKRAGAEYVFLEVTSEGIKQFRHKFIKFYAAILTNLSLEHIESHGGFENYRLAKAELFKIAPIHLINGDDENFNFFNNIPARNRAGWPARLLRCGQAGQAQKKVVFKMSDYPKDLNINLAGEFNKMNAVAALAFAQVEKIAPEVAKSAIQEVKVLPGRMEFIEELAHRGKKFKVLVDYAFLPQALRKVYETLNKDFLSYRATGRPGRNLKSKKLVCVIGACGGGRDKWKRPVLGDVANEFCRKTIVTNEDPYDEDPMEIINQVAGKHNFLKILDRREAIQEALKSARPGDIVVVSGKGAEPWIMGPQGSKIAWDDRVVAKEELKNTKILTKGRKRTKIRKGIYESTK